MDPVPAFHGHQQPGFPVELVMEVVSGPLETIRGHHIVRLTVASQVQVGDSAQGSQDRRVRSEAVPIPLDEELLPEPDLFEADLLFPLISPTAVGHEQACHGDDTGRDDRRKGDWVHTGNVWLHGGPRTAARRQRRRDAVKPAGLTNSPPTAPVAVTSLRGAGSPPGDSPPAMRRVCPPGAGRPACRGRGRVPGSASRVGAPRATSSTSMRPASRRRWA
jgi:hypothetical protein